MLWFGTFNEPNPWTLLKSGSAHAQRIPMEFRIALQRAVQKWGYTDNDNTYCDCGTAQTMQHLLQCPNLEVQCSQQDLMAANEKALGCAKSWPNIGNSLLVQMLDTEEEWSTFIGFSSQL